MDKVKPIVLSMAPGAGKTQYIVDRIYDAINSGIAPDEIYAITFTIEAAIMLKDRTDGNVRASTIHSLAAGIIKAEGKQVEDTGINVYDNILTEATLSLKAGPGLKISLLCVDEAQDLNQLQFDFILELCRAADRIVIVGDEFQSIYGFQGSSPDYMSYLSKELGVDISESNQSFRIPEIPVKYINRVFEKNIIPTAGERGSVSVISESEAGSRGHTHKVYDFFLDSYEGRTGILFRTNLEVSSFIMSSGNPERYNYTIDIKDHPFFALVSYMINREKHIDFKSLAILAEYLGYGVYNFTKFLNLVGEACVKHRTFVPADKLIARMKKTGAVAGVAVQSMVYSYLESLFESLEYYIQDFNLSEESLSDYLHHVKQYGFDLEPFYDIGDELIIEHILAFFENGTSICRINNESNISVMTVHAAKGLEFDNVMYMLNKYMSITDPEEYRIAYVAMTRAKRNLMIYVPFNAKADPTEPNLYHNIIRNSGGI